MNYTKPRVTPIAYAANIVRGDDGKPSNPFPDNDGSGDNATIGAYDADE